MVEKNGTLSKKSRLGEAFSYVLNHGMPSVITVMTVWRRRIIMLRKERFVQSVSEEKLYVFGSDHGGERGALLYGLIGTCRLNGIDPEAYLRHILSVLPEWPSNRVDELLPWNVVLTNK
ncbi:putative transposase [Escherichia coli MP021566.1]|nr:putative transposase [Escherichia coli MP021566.1]